MDIYDISSRRLTFACRVVHAWWCMHCGACMVVLAALLLSVLRRYCMHDAALVLVLLVLLVLSVLSVCC